MKGQVDRCRNAHGWATWDRNTREYERLNRRAPVIEVTIQADGTTYHFEVYRTRRRARPHS